MKTEIVHSLTNTFEAHAQQTEGGIEYWLARDIQHLLGYTKWDNFLNVVSKAKTACDVSEHQTSDHFADVSKMVDLGSGSQREVPNIDLITEQDGKLRVKGNAANDPCSALKTTRKAEINPEACATLNSDTSRPFPKPKSGRIAVKVINHLGDEVMKVFRVV